MGGLAGCAQQGGAPATTRQSVGRQRVGPPEGDGFVAPLDSQGVISSSGRRSALLIANHNYGDDRADLNNPAKDVALVASALRAVGFKAPVIRRNLTKDGLRNAVRAFAKTLKKGDEAFFYYSGHGIALRGRSDEPLRNYLVGTAFQAADEIEAVNDGDLLLVSEVVTRLESTGANVRIIVIDACRDQPFTRSWTKGGLNDYRAFVSVARERTGEGTFLAFSSRLGQRALDGVRGLKTGPYAHALARHIATPNRDVRVVFGAIGSDVRRLTNKTQWPDYRDALDGQYYFKRVQVAPPPPTAPPAAVRRRRTETGPPRPPPSVSKPRWASSVGEDRFGVYADVTIPGTRASFRMRRIQPGRFVMGSPKTEEGRFNGEGPQHRVTISRGFWMADSECTQAVYEAVTGKNPSRFKGADRPVEQVSWDDAQAFLRTINRRIPGLDLRLPTEAEWEYAARAGTTAARHGELDAVAWYDGTQTAERIR